MIDKIQKLAETHFEELVDIRRYLHRHPELSFKEVNTSKYIQKCLSKYGIEFSTGWAGHGIVGMIHGQNAKGKITALRADIDALPIIEANQVEYKSLHDGVMHACGHDVHTTCLLGALIILNKLRSEWQGSIKFLFQPAEEKLPGGASIMIEEGVLRNPRPTGIFGQHVHPPMETGKVGFRIGESMASADEIFIEIHGVGGHAALPHTYRDPIQMAAQLIIGLRQLIGRANPIVPTVLSIGKINSVGGATNIVPSVVKMEGTFRTMDEEWRKEAHSMMKKSADAMVAAMGGKCHFDIRKGYPVLQNEKALTFRAWRAAEDFLGTNQVEELPIRLSAEDFAYYSQKIPACFYRLGTGNKAKGIISPVHTDTFDIDEDSLKIGAGLMAYLSIRELTHL